MVHLSLHLTSNMLTSSMSWSVSAIMIAFDSELPVSLSVFAINGIVELGTLAIPNPQIWLTSDPQLHIVHILLEGALVTLILNWYIYDQTHKFSSLWGGTTSCNGLKHWHRLWQSSWWMKMFCS
jgi:hypothetical protein